MAYSPIEESYMNGFVSSQFETPPEPVLLAENTGAMPTQQPMTDTSGGAAVGTRLKMPSGLNTPENMRQVGSEVIPAGAAIAKGAGQASVGMYGDIEGLGRMVLNYMGVDVNKETKLPTTEDVKTFLDKYIPVDEKYATFEKAGELASPAGAYGLGKAAVKTVKATKNVPVGMSTQAVGEGVDQLGFYSAARQAVDSIQQPKGTGDQFLKQIEKTPGVKPDEIKWTGLDEFLKSKKSVTKAEVQEYLDKNRVEIKEVNLADDPYKWQGNFLMINKTAVAKIEDTSDGFVLHDNINGGTTKLEANNMQDAVAKAENIYGLNKPAQNADGAPKFDKYTLPGGENYREVLLTLPTNMSEYNKFSDSLRAKYGDGGFDNLPLTEIERARLNKFYADEEKQPFKSQHFDQPNILAHLRVNDRVDADGKKVLFVEEVQSDWHQAGRKKGYQGDIEPSKIAYEKAAQASHDYFKEMYVAHGVFGKDAEKLKELDKLSDGAKNLVMETLLKEMSPEETAQYEKLFNQTKDTLTTYMGAKRSAVPDAPFKTTWSELAMKRAIQMASEGGYDRIAFTTGKTQAERFDLSKEISDLTITRNKTDFSISANDKNGNPVIGKTIPDLRNLDEYVGKDLAEKVKDDFANKSGSEHIYSGLDLQVGGEGMKGFYDDILPKFLNKYAKKWDAKAGMTNIITNDEIEIIKANAAKAFGKDSDDYKQAVKNAMEEVHYIDITPKMRESVVTKGQPMFAVGGASAGAASQQEENK